MSKTTQLDRKYAQLLLKKCLCFKNTDSLLIEYVTHEHDNFVKIIIEEAKKMGVKNIRVSCSDSDELHKYISKTKIEDMKLNPLFDRSLWDETAKNHGCILHINTFIPNLMNDVDDEKIKKMNQIIAPTFTYYRTNNKYNFPWVICAYPNKRWAEFLFKNDSDAYIKLYNYIIEMCMINTDDPSLAWDNYIKQINEYKQKLEDMNITKLFYKNDLGTEFEIGFPKNYRWINIDKKDNFGNSIIVNMPSYEIFTTPDYRTANGIVYSSRPLIFQGKIINDFYIEFKDGIVTNYRAKKGNEHLKALIENYYNSNRLGEVALVNNNSPISNTGIVFYNTLFDENASCHLSLGNSNPTAIDGFETLTLQELDTMGINHSNIHIDFMIGTPDLQIIANTKKGKKLIFKEGNFDI